MGDPTIAGAGDRGAGPLPRGAAPPSSEFQADLGRPPDPQPAGHPAVLAISAGGLATGHASAGRLSSTPRPPPAAGRRRGRRPCRARWASVRVPCPEPGACGPHHDARDPCPRTTARGPRCPGRAAARAASCDASGWARVWAEASAATSGGAWASGSRSARVWDVAWASGSRSGRGVGRGGGPPSDGRRNCRGSGSSQRGHGRKARRQGRHRRGSAGCGRGRPRGRWARANDRSRRDARAGRRLRGRRRATRSRRGREGQFGCRRGCRLRSGTECRGRRNRRRR